MAKRFPHSVACGLSRCDPRRAPPWSLPGSAAHSPASALALTVVIGTAGAAASRLPTEAGGAEPRAEGALVLDPGQLDSLRKRLDATRFPIAEDALEKRLGVELSRLRRGLSATAGAGTSRSFDLGRHCVLWLYGDVHDDDVHGAEVRCGADVQGRWRDRRSALESLRLTEDDLGRLDRCGGLVAGLDPVVVECYRLDGERELTLEVSDEGVRAWIRAAADTGPR